MRLAYIMNIIRYVQLNYGETIGRNQTGKIEIETFQVRRKFSEVLNLPCALFLKERNFWLSIINC